MANVVKLLGHTVINSQLLTPLVVTVKSTIVTCYEISLFHVLMIHVIYEMFFICSLLDNTLLNFQKVQKLVPLLITNSVCVRMNII